MNMADLVTRDLAGKRFVIGSDVQTTTALFSITTYFLTPVTIFLGIRKLTLSKYRVFLVRS